MKDRRRTKKIYILIVLAFLAIGVQQFASLPATPEAIFFDVGQGDATLINGPQNIQIVIDGGPDDTVVKKFGRYLPVNDRTIEIVLVSHPDSDHLTGLIELAHRYAITQVVQPAFAADSPVIEEWRAVLKEKNIPVIEATAGMSFTFPGQGRLEILSPKKSVVYKDTNAQSIICTYQSAGVKLLFLGDATPESQDALLGERGLENVQSIKISHHGSEKSYSSNLIDMINPGLAIIQVGANNRFGHPSPSVIQRLKEKNITVRRTDQEGDVVVPLTADTQNSVPIFEKILFVWYNLVRNIKSLLT
ncbi:MAG: MBL fold metallo-hydrolase [Patescibacteria group bacterium]